MKRFLRGFPLLLTAALCWLSLGGCAGDNPVRVSSATPAAPAGVSASAGDRQVFLSWTPSTGAGAYRIYYGTSPGVGSGTGTVVNVPGTSGTITGLANGTTYHFVVTALVADGQSAASAEVSATPAPAGAFAQQDLEGVWNFNVLISGSAPGWMRGAITVGSGGAVSYTLYQDSSGGSSAPAPLFPALLVDSAGEVRDTAETGFRGAMSASRNLVAGSGQWTGSNRYFAILQRQLPVTFLPADLQGFGGTGGGARRFVYHQLSTGPGGEWEWGAGQIGRDQKVQYASLSAPSNPALPGEKATILNISTDGMVTESLTGAAGAPTVVMDRLVMSGDKTMMVGVATDSSHAARRYVLRIYEMINMIANDPNTFVAADLAGSYQFQKLVSGTTTVTASGSLLIGSVGNAGFGSYLDSAGATSSPAFSLTLDTDGVVVGGADAVHGKLSYMKDLLVLTGTEGGGYSMTIGLKR